MAFPTGTVTFAPPTRKKAVLAPDKGAVETTAFAPTPEGQAQAAALSATHADVAKKFKESEAAALKKANAFTGTFAGFGVSDITQYFGVDPRRAVDIINAANAGTGLEAMFQAGVQHLAEHPKGSHYRGDFNVGDAAARAGAAFASGGFSEVVREKPFQPSGGNPSVLEQIPGIAAGASLLKGAKNLTSPASVPQPATPAPRPDQAAVKSALDKADIERRKQLAANNNFSSVLGLTGDATVKRSVLG